MRRLALFSLIALVIVACGKSGLSEPGQEWDDRSIYRENLIPDAAAVLDELPGATVYHMDVGISEDRLSLKGHQRVRYTNREDVSLADVYFRLFPNRAGGKATIANLTVDGRAMAPLYEYGDTALCVALDPALAPGDSITIEMDFDVQVAQEMDGNYGLFGYFDGVLVLDEFYPVIPVYDDEGWNVELPPPNADLAYYDASFYRVIVSAPRDLVVVASGVATDQGEVDGLQWMTYVAGPARHFYLAASSDYVLASAKVGETTINSYTAPEGGRQSDDALEIATHAIKSFNKRFGVYPYTELDMVATPMQALGMEYPGIVAIRGELYDPDAVVRGIPSQVLLEGVLAHEVGHQWFYNAVGSDQVDEPWVDEAVVQYITGLYFLDRYGDSGWQGYRGSWEERWDRVGGADIPIGLPAGQYQGKEYGAIVYGRGPLFLDTLAQEMGQKAFDGFLRDYYQANLWGIGTGAELEAMAEESCQCDLTPLFHEWVYP